MSDKDAITTIRQMKREGLLGKERTKLVNLIQSVNSTNELEKVGYLLRDITVNDWNTGEKNEVKTIKIAILSNFTCETMAHYLRTFMIGHELWPEIYVANFNQYFYELINKDSHLYQFKPDVTICLLDEQILLAELQIGWNAEILDTLIDKKIQEFQQLLHVFQENCNGVIILNTFPISPNTSDSFLDYKSKAKLSKKWRKFEYDMLELSEQYKQVIVLDLNVLMQKIQASALPDSRLFNYAHMNMSENMLMEISKEVVKVVRAQRGLSKKCLVLDLDNTLWGGIVGDDGIEGIQLGNDYPGNVYLEFQRKIKHLKEQGILLAICSKNEEATVREALRAHPDMQLREEDFVLICANWEPKHDNIKKIADRLNIGIDSLVFIDDNPFEREMVRSYIEQLVVPEMSDEPSNYIRNLLSDGWFNSLALTKEDLERTHKYKQQEKRREFEEHASSLDDYLHGLDIQLYLLNPTPMNLPRLTQLNLRTNQFNMTTRRYQQAEMESMALDEDYKIIGFQAKDKFGDYGIIGSTVLQKDPERPEEIWWIRNFLMSCRVFSRGIETAVLHEIFRLAKEKGVQRINGEYIPSKKNVIVKDFYDNHGFHLMNEETTHQIFTHELQSTVNEVPWITVYPSREEAVSR